ncbi:MAG: hypothetical protein LBG95_02665 [Treponema sp.]|nr:hypothetical protein [Treponema sp.]
MVYPSPKDCHHSIASFKSRSENIRLFRFADAWRLNIACRLISAISSGVDSGSSLQSIGLSLRAASRARDSSDN